MEENRRYSWPDGNGRCCGHQQQSHCAPVPVPAGTAPPGPVPIMPDGTLRLTPPTTERFGPAATVEEIGAISGSPPLPHPAFNHAAPGAEFAPDEHL